MTDTCSKKEMFPITSVCRDDIIHAFRDTDVLEQVKKKVKIMDDTEMEYLASKLADDYCEQLYYIPLPLTVEYHINR